MNKVVFGLALLGFLLLSIGIMNSFVENLPALVIQTHGHVVGNAGEEELAQLAENTSQTDVSRTSYSPIWIAAGIGFLAIALITKKKIK